MLQLEYLDKIGHKKWKLSGSKKKEHHKVSKEEKKVEKVEG